MSDLKESDSSPSWIDTFSDKALMKVTLYARCHLFILLLSIL